MVGNSKLPKTSYFNLSFNFEEKKRFGDVVLSGQLNYADLCIYTIKWTQHPFISKKIPKHVRNGEPLYINYNCQKSSLL